MLDRVYHIDGTSPHDNWVFVFGSNLSGYHGGGAAAAAHVLYGAKWGKAEGLSGRSYALPTVKEFIAGPLGVDEIRLHVEKFLQFANDHSELSFFVTRVGCGLAGHQDEDIAPMFRDAPLNCSLPLTWKPYL